MSRKTNNTVNRKAEMLPDDSDTLRARLADMQAEKQARAKERAMKDTIVRVWIEGLMGILGVYKNSKGVASCLDNEQRPFVRELTQELKDSREWVYGQLYSVFFRVVYGRKFGLGNAPESFADDSDRIVESSLQYTYNGMIDGISLDQVVELYRDKLTEALELYTMQKRQMVAGDKVSKPLMLREILSRLVDSQAKENGWSKWSGGSGGASELDD